MSIEVTLFETKEKIEVMLHNIGTYKFYDGFFSVNEEKYCYTEVQLRWNGNINVVETVAEIKAKIDAVDYLKKISDSLGDLTFRLECLDNVLRKL